MTPLKRERKVQSLPFWADSALILLFWCSQVLHVLYRNSKMNLPSSTCNWNNGLKSHGIMKCSRKGGGRREGNVDESLQRQAARADSSGPRVPMGQTSRQIKCIQYLAFFSKHCKTFPGGIKLHFIYTNVLFAWEDKDVLPTFLVFVFFEECGCLICVPNSLIRLNHSIFKRLQNWRY